jgi:hypothetical protein
MPAHRSASSVHALVVAGSAACDPAYTAEVLANGRKWAAIVRVT